MCKAFTDRPQIEKADYMETTQPMFSGSFVAAGYTYIRSWMIPKIMGDMRDAWVRPRMVEGVFMGRRTVGIYPCFAFDKFDENQGDRERFVPGTCRNFSVLAGLV